MAQTSEHPKDAPAPSMPGMTRSSSAEAAANAKIRSRKRGKSLGKLSSHSKKISHMFNTLSKGVNKKVTTAKMKMSRIESSPEPPEMKDAFARFERINARIGTFLDPVVPSLYSNNVDACILELTFAEHLLFLEKPKYQDADDDLFREFAQNVMGRKLFKLNTMKNEYLVKMEKEFINPTTLFQQNEISKVDKLIEQYVLLKREYDVANHKYSKLTQPDHVKVNKNKIKKALKLKDHKKQLLQKRRKEFIHMIDALQKKEQIGLLNCFDKFWKSYAIFARRHAQILELQDNWDDKYKEKRRKRPPVIIRDDSKDEHNDDDAFVNMNIDTDMSKNMLTQEPNDEDYKQTDTATTDAGLVETGMEEDSSDGLVEAIYNDDDDVGGSDKDTPPPPISPTYSIDIINEITNNDDGNGNDDGNTKEIAKEHRYKNPMKLGSGAFATVYKANDILNIECQVAIKKIAIGDADNVLYLSSTKEEAENELILMQTLSNHVNIVTLVDDYYEETIYNDLYLNLVMEYVQDTLISRCNYYADTGDTIPHNLIKVYGFQLAKAINYMHLKQICHRDIKPDNVLINIVTNEVKLCDFGCSLKMNKIYNEDLDLDDDSKDPSSSNEKYISYVCSRYYRAPELILQSERYDCKVDIWSLGCLMAELFLGTLLFCGDQDETDHFDDIMRKLGPPSEADIDGMNVNYKYKDELLSCDDLGESWDLMFCAVSNMPQKAVNFISSMLKYSPKDRITSLMCVKHPYFDGLIGGQNKTLYDWTDEELEYAKSKGVSLQ